MTSRSKKTEEKQKRNRALPRRHAAFASQIAYKPKMPIKISDEWNIQARVLTTLRDNRPKGMSLKKYLTPIAEELGISYESLYKWVTGMTRNPKIWTVVGVAQYLDNTHGRDWY